MNPRVIAQTTLDDDFAFTHYRLTAIIGSLIEEMTYIDQRHPHYIHTH